MASYLPQDDGLLPKFLLLLAVVSVGNSFQCYLTTSYTARVYSSPTANVTPLSARTFGTYTFLASVIRFYAAYNITDPVMFQLALWTFAVAFVHFYSEWFIFGTTKFGEGLAGPALVSVGGLIWMFWQWGEYVS